MDRAAFYKKKEWKEIRESVLRRAEYKDELESRAGKSVPATMVHHIFPLEKYPEYGLERWNLISVSNDTHEILHNRATGELSPLGYDLLHEVSEKRKIPLSRVILVCGRSSRKAEFVKRHMKHGIVYDIDYLSAAFRLKKPNEENYEPARKIARDMFLAFSINACKYSSLVWVIKSVPSIEQIAEIRPSTVYMLDSHITKNTQKEKAYTDILNEIEGYCRDSCIDFQKL